VFEKRVLRRIFGLKRDEMREVGENYIMKSFITCTLCKYHYNDQAKEDEMGMSCSTNGEKRNACRVLVGKPEGNRSLG
jgi:hypothetical protein